MHAVSLLRFTLSELLLSDLYAWLDDYLGLMLLECVISMKMGCHGDGWQLWGSSIRNLEIL